MFGEVTIKENNGYEIVIFNLTICVVLLKIYNIRCSIFDSRFNTMRPGFPCLISVRLAWSGRKSIGAIMSSISTNETGVQVSVRIVCLSSMTYLKFNVFIAI